LASNYTRQDVEILIATMHRNSLDFLIPMFPFAHFSDFNILIINQTSENHILVSGFPNVRVINSFEKGLSRSRNLAIQNASKEIGLISDDDVVYYKGFDDEVANAFNQLTEASVVTFNHQRIGLEKPQNDSLNPYIHNSKTIWDVCSIEIALKPGDSNKNKLYFNEDFGLGSHFETAEELLFLRKALQLNANPHYFPSVIVSHPLLTSGDDQGSDKLVFARAALSYELRKVLTYIWLPKYLLFLYRYKFIQKNEFVKKFKAGLSGIQKFRQLQKENKS